MRRLQRYSLAVVVLALSGCASTSGRQMEGQIYTVGVWHVKPGHEADFVAAWKELSDIFTSLPNPPGGTGVLVQSTADPTLFYSWGGWRSLEDVAAMRANQRAHEGIGKLRKLCTEATPGSFRVVAESR